jgi:futalosine hydrolase
VILLACAVPKELSRWKARGDVETCVTGVGPVEAATAVARALALRSYDLVVNAGIAGAFEGAAAVGDGVVVKSDRMELDRESGEPIALPNGELIVDAAHSEPRLVGILEERGFAALAGVTVARVTASEATARRLAKSGAQTESMEGFAVLRAAARAGVPAIQVRGISNRVGIPESSGWDFAAGMGGLDRVMHALFGALP